MHTLQKVHTCGHLYRPGGEDDLPPEQFTLNAIVETRDLPGFVEDRTDGSPGVTYESHHFWVHFAGSNGWGEVLIMVHHGGGWEVWRGDYMLAAALRGFGPDDRALFKLCWYMIDSAKERHKQGAEEASARFREAFANGWLKKRKARGSNSVKVWIDGLAEARSQAAAQTAVNH